MSQPLVSVVTPSYNQAQYLEDSIESVLAQDYPSIEYLIADGGSTDGSVEIIKKYQSQLSWWVSEADEGQAAAINKGMAKAQGEIVAWLNSDDLYLPGAVKEAVAALQQNPKAKMVFGNAITIDAQGVPLKELIFPNWSLEDLVGFRIICQPAVFMRHDAYQQVNGLDPDYHFMLDHHLWIRIAGKGPILHRDSFWAAARHHGAAKNVSQAPAFGRETMEILDWMQGQDDLGLIVKDHRRKVQAGAYRLNGRYLLDGDLYGPALKSYGQAFINQPLYTTRHWRRILYACLGVLGVKNLDSLYTSFQAAQRPNLSSKTELRDWPGLCVD